MKQWRIPILVGALVVAFVIAMGSAGAASSPFTGSWTSADAVDGSSQFLSIGGGPSPRVTLYDRGASTCDDSLTVAARGTGQATSVSATQLVVPIDLYCLDSPSYYHLTVTVTFTYDPVTETLQDSLDPPTTWHRRGS